MAKLSPPPDSLLKIIFFLAQMCQYLKFNISSRAPSLKVWEGKKCEGERTTHLLINDVWCMDWFGFTNYIFQSNFKTSFWHSLTRFLSPPPSALVPKINSSKAAAFVCTWKTFWLERKKTADFLITREMRVAHKLRELNKRVEREFHFHSASAAFWSRANEDRK